MGPDYQEQHTVGQHAGNEVDISPLNHTQLAGDAFFDLEAALQLPGLLSWEPDSRVVLGQDDGTAQQPTFSQQPFPQTLTNDEFAFQWQDLNASAFAQQIPDHDTIGQTFLNEEPLDQQIHDLHDPTQTFAGQGIFEQQMLLQQPFVGYTVGQEMSGLVWTQQSIPDQISLNYVPLQPLFMEQQEQVEVPQFPATRAALGIAPCHILAAIEAPSSEVTPHFDMCGRCNEPFEVARNRGDACLFHRAPRPNVDFRHPYWDTWDDAKLPRDNPFIRAKVPDAFVWPCCSSLGSFPGCSSDAHKSNDDFVTDAVQQLVHEQVQAGQITGVDSSSLRSLLSKF